MQTFDSETAVEENTALVGHIVREVMGRVPSQVDREDLISAGLLALVQASRTFDAELGVPFARYAARRIRGAIIDELRTLDWASRSVRRRAREFDRVRQDLAAHLGRSATDVEVAEASGVEVSEVRASADDVSRASLMSLSGPNESTLAESISSDAPDPQAHLLHLEQLQALKAAVCDLPERSRLVVEGYYLQQRPMAELAAELNVTESRISQIRAEALRMLNAGMLALAGDGEQQPQTADQPKRVAAYVAAVNAGRAVRRNIRVAGPSVVATA